MTFSSMISALLLFRNSIFYAMSLVFLCLLQWIYWHQFSFSMYSSLFSIAILIVFHISFILLHNVFLLMNCGDDVAQLMFLMLRLDCWVLMLCVVYFVQ